MSIFIVILLFNRVDVSVVLNSTQLKFIKHDSSRADLK